MAGCKEDDHKFTARYEQKPNKSINVEYYAGNIKQILYYDVYLFDICEKCGKVLNVKALLEADE